MRHPIAIALCALAACTWGEPAPSWPTVRSMSSPATASAVAPLRQAWTGAPPETEQLFAGGIDATAATAIVAEVSTAFPRVTVHGRLQADGHLSVGGGRAAVLLLGEAW